MEISANSFDFDDLFPGSPEAGYFFLSIEKVLVFAKTGSINLSTVEGLSGKCFSV
jgi:hypothetical protein